MRRLLAAGALAAPALVLLLAASEAGSIDASRKAAVESALSGDVPRLLCVGDRVATGGQPRDAAWPKLAKLGFRSVLTLRTPEEVDLGKQKTAVEAAGLKFLNVPVGYPSDAQLDQFLALVRDPSNQPMLIQCSVGFRVGLFWMVHRALDDGWPVEKALEEARQIGLRGSAWEQWGTRAIAARQPARKP